MSLLQPPSKDLAPYATGILHILVRPYAGLKGGCNLQL